MKRITLALLMVALASPLVSAEQELNTLLADFGRPLKKDGITLFVIHLNDKTVEALFSQSPRKQALRVQARQAAMFYVQGVADKDLEVNTTFAVTQGRVVPGTAYNVTNFEHGKKVAKGQRIDGFVAFNLKLNLSEPFTVQSGGDAVEFQLSEKAVNALGN